MPLTTVREAIEFSAELRLPASVTVSQRAAFVDEILELLELAPLASSKVGTPGAPDGLAPGERKRLTIAVELAANAPILFLDEPTSGLDARAAMVVARVIRRVASTGRTIICTVHQPSAELFAQFDDLLLLQRGGWLSYFGPIGGRRARALLDYLQALPESRACPPGYNPASFMLDVLAGTDSSGAMASAAGGGSSTQKLDGSTLQSRLLTSEQWSKGAAPMLSSCAHPSSAPCPSPSPRLTRAISLTRSPSSRGAPGACTSAMCP